MMFINNYSADILLSSIAILINILMTFLFLARAKKIKRQEYVIGIILIILSVPILTIAMLNYLSGREWWTYILPLPMVLFLIIELFFDYIYQLDFRDTKLLFIYLPFYYLGLFGLLGYAFLTNKTLGYILLATYFIHQIALWYAHKK